MKKLILSAISIGVLILAAGCNSSEGTMSKDEENALKNPSKEIPKEALEGMSKMGENIKKQQEANAAAGVDSRGVPLSKSTEKAPPPPVGN